MKAYVPEVTPLPEGDHKIKIRSVEEITNKFAKPEDKAYRQKQFQWTLESDEVEGSVILWTGTALSDKSNLLSWTEAVLNKSNLSIEERKEVDLEDLVGKEVMVQIVHKKDDKGNNWAKVAKWWSISSK